MNLSDLAGSLMAVAKNLIPVMLPGSGPLIAAGSALLDAMYKVKADLTEPVEGFDETLDELHARVNAKADALADRLAGDQP